MNTFDLGDRVKAARIEHGLSLRQLARTAQVDDSWLSKLERGIHSTPDPRSLDRLAAALELDTADLFASAGYSRRGLPVFAPYLRAKYDLPDDAISHLEAEFDRINEQYLREQGGAS